MWILNFLPAFNKGRWNEDNPERRAVETRENEVWEREFNNAAIYKL
jgi:hypothetical protein